MVQRVSEDVEVLLTFPVGSSEDAARRRIDRFEIPPWMRLAAPPSIVYVPDGEGQRPVHLRIPLQYVAVPSERQLRVFAEHVGSLFTGFVWPGGGPRAAARVLRERERQRRVGRGPRRRRRPA